MMFDICTVKGLQQRIGFKYLIFSDYDIIYNDNVECPISFPTWGENLKLVLGLCACEKFYAPRQTYRCQDVLCGLVLFCTKQRILSAGFCD
jgi:hypothetical protein